MTFRWRSSTLPTKPRGHHDKRNNTLCSCWSYCLVAAKSTPGSYPWRLRDTYVVFAMRVIHGPPAECNTPLHFGWITLEAKQLNSRVRGYISPYVLSSVPRRREGRNFRLGRRDAVADPGLVLLGLRHYPSARRPARRTDRCQEDFWREPRLGVDPDLRHAGCCILGLQSTHCAPGFSWSPPRCDLPFHARAHCQVGAPGWEVENIFFYLCR